jgi:hypothetical protein
MNRIDLITLERHALAGPIMAALIADYGREGGFIHAATGACTNNGKGWEPYLVSRGVVFDPLTMVRDVVVVLTIDLTERARVGLANTNAEKYLANAAMELEGDGHGAS